MDISGILYLTKENARFYDKDGFLALEAFIPPKSEYDLDEEETKEPCWQDLGRVFLHRAFPHELLWEYISVLGEESREIGLIYNIEDFNAETTAILKTELERKYYSPAILEINGVKERYGFSYWKVKLEDGRSLNFTMRDTFRNIVHTGEDSAILIDVDGNRYSIKEISALDRKSYRRIELYL